jgi:hypothetical protein
VKWLNWSPRATKFEETPEIEPTEPTEPGFGSFGGSSSAHIENFFEADRALLNRLGVRLIRSNGRLLVGVWSDLDSPALRQSLKRLRLDRCPVVHLETANVPLRFKVRTKG